MINNDNYPLGAANDISAPWNQGANSAITIDVDVYLTLKKTVRIETTDYEERYYGKDEDGFPDVDYEYGNLEDEVLEQITLPHELAKVIIDEHLMLSTRASRAIEEADGWYLEEVSVEVA